MSGIVPSFRSPPSNALCAVVVFWFGATVTLGALLLFMAEPMIGRIPLVDLIMKCPEYSTPGAHGSVTVFATVIWLHVGPDEYVPYSLEGGP